MFEEIEFNNWSELREYFSKQNSNWIYRGQADYKWNLLSAIDRVSFSHIDNVKSKREFEQYCIYQIKKLPHLYADKHMPNSDFQIISLLQHHGSPTRLLDFSVSPYVAVFFAIENMTSDGSVYAIDNHNLLSSTHHLARKNIDKKHADLIKHFDDLSNDENFKRIFLMENQLDFVQLVQPYYLFDRIIQQSGGFLCQGNIDKTFEENLYENSKIWMEFENAEKPKKFKLKIEWKEQILRELLQMNITRQSLFPGIEGTLNSLKHKFDISAKDRC